MSKKKNILDEINEEDAYVILRKLISEDKDIKKRIEKIAIDHFSDVDNEDIAEQVFCELDRIDVHDLWDQSGSTRDGYVDPYERSWEMFEEQLEPFIDQMRKYLHLAMYPEAKQYCIGILKGLHSFEKNATTEFADWAEDAPKNYFEIVYEKWKEKHSIKEDIEEVDQLIKKELNDW